jgi:hypothetical protein
MNVKGIPLTREEYIAFLQKEGIHKHIYPKATKSIAIHLVSITSKVITSLVAYYGQQAYETSTSLWNMLQMRSMIQRCKHDMVKKMKMHHSYVHQPSQLKLKKEKQLQALLADEQM